MSKPRGILGQAGPLMLGRAGAAVVGFALPLILTRLLPQAQFGTYKQIWLVVTTAYFMLQLGLAQSLYYFVPRKDGRARVWLTQASLSLLTLGGVCAVTLYASRFAVARQFANPELADFGLQMALITWLMIASAPLEISLTAEGRVRTAACASRCSAGSSSAAAGRASSGTCSASSSRMPCRSAPPCCSRSRSGRST